MIASPDDDEPKRGGPEWLVTYADFMTLLLAFFVLIVSVSDINLHDGRFDSLRSSLGRHFGGENALADAAPGPIEPRNAPLSKWVNRSQDERRHWLSTEDGGAVNTNLALQTSLRFENRAVSLTP